MIRMNRVRPTALLRCSTLALAPVLAALTASAQSYVLGLHPGSSVEFPHDPIMNTGDAATIEAWVLAQPGSVPGSSLSVFSRYADMQEHKELVILDDGSIRYLYAGSPWEQPPIFGGAPPAPPGSFPIDGKWHHLAFVRHADGTWQIFVDGNEKLGMGPGTGLGNGCWLTCNVINAATLTRISVTTPWMRGSGWFLDELRVSSTARYSTAFTPAHGWNSDPDTVMLVAFDEGQGTLVADDGPAGQVGLINGPADWYPSCCIPVEFQICCLPYSYSDAWIDPPDGPFYCPSGELIDPDSFTWIYFLYAEAVSWINESALLQCYSLYEDVEDASYAAYHEYLDCLASSSYPEACLSQYRSTCESICASYDAQIVDVISQQRQAVRHAYSALLRGIEGVILTSCD